MSEVLVKIDSKEVDDALSKLSDGRRVRGVMNKGIKAMQNVYYDSIMSSLRKRVPNAEVPNINKQMKYPLITGGYKKDRMEQSLYKVIFEKDFRLRFFEAGTEQRYVERIRKTTQNGKRKPPKLKKYSDKGFRGQLKATHFFTLGIEEGEVKAFNAFANSIFESLRIMGIKLDEE